MVIVKMYFLIGLIFGLLGGSMSGFITYEEYKRHFIDSNRPIKEASRYISFYIPITTTYYCWDYNY